MIIKLRFYQLNNTNFRYFNSPISIAELAIALIFFCITVVTVRSTGTIGSKEKVQGTCPPVEGPQKDLERIIILFKNVLLQLNKVLFFFLLK